HAHAYVERLFQAEAMRFRLKRIASRKCRPRALLWGISCVPSTIEDGAGSDLPPAGGRRGASGEPASPTASTPAQPGQPLLGFRGAELARALVLLARFHTIGDDALPL